MALDLTGHYIIISSPKTRITKITQIRQHVKVDLYSVPESGTRGNTIDFN